MRRATPPRCSNAENRARSFHPPGARPEDRSETALVAVATDSPVDTARPGKRSSLGSSVLRQMARTGIYDTTSYQTASHARMAVLTHLANFPITLPQIQERLSKDFSGLAAAIWRLRPDGPFAVYGVGQGQNHRWYKTGLQNRRGEKFP